LYSSKHAILQDECRDAINMLYGNSFGGLFVSALAGSVLVFGFETADIQSLKYWWWYLFMTCLLIRFADVIYWKTKLADQDFTCLWPLRRFAIGAIITATLWSGYTIMVFKDVEFIELAYTVIIISAMAGGSVTVLAGSKIISIAYSSILLVPPSLLFINSSREYDYLIGFLSLAFAVVMVISAIKIAKFTENAIRLKNHNRLLVNNMHAEKQEVSRINAKLNVAYKEINRNNIRLEREVIKRTEQIHQLSNLDPLTRLYNRNAFIQALRKLLVRSTVEELPLAVLFIDLDRFKQINDALGHKIGDKVLKVVTQRIYNLRSNGNVGRWGGDEFVLALPECNEQWAKSHALQLIESIASTIKIGALKLNVGASIGIAIFPTHSRKEMQLIQYADIAMYEQKKSSENLPRIFSNNLLLKLQRKEHLQEGLREAVKTNSLFLMYQPIMNATGKEITSCEALIRWTYDQEEIPANVFIEIAEQSGLIIEIGRWVILRACLDAKKWNNVKQCKVSVNVSMSQLLDHAFISNLDEILRQSQLPANLLVLEITESIFSKNQDRIRKLLVQIKSRKIGVSIDDFGTGYSSLSQLQTLPFDTIKIDRSFVKHLHDKGDAIIKATLFIAKEFNCNCVAEGVETQQQADELKVLGVNFLQGFLFAKPLCLPKLLEYMNVEETELID